MPVRAEIVRKKLLDIGESLGRLRSWLPVTVERFECDLMLQWAVEHGLQIAAEALFDVGSHILAGEFQESVDEYREIPGPLAGPGRAVGGDREAAGRACGLPQRPRSRVRRRGSSAGSRTPVSTEWVTSMRSLPTSTAGLLG